MKDIDEQIEKNVEKTKKRYEKMGVDPNTVMQDYGKKKPQPASQKKKENTVNAATVTKKVNKTNYRSTANTKYKEGSIASYANILQRDTTNNKK